MEESEGSDRTPGTVLERCQSLENTVVQEFPDIVENTSVERSPGDTPRNLRIFLPEGFVDVFVSDDRYSFHWQREENSIRFDNSPHHQNLETFPDHMHKGGNISKTVLDGETVEEKLVQALEFIDNNYL